MWAGLPQGAWLAVPADPRAGEVLWLPYAGMSLYLYGVWIQLYLYRALFSLSPSLCPYYTYLCSCMCLGSLTEF